MSENKFEHTCGEQNAKYAWGTWRTNEAKKSVERATLRLRDAQNNLRYVEHIVAQNDENAVELKLRAKQTRLSEQLEKTNALLENV